MRSHLVFFDLIQSATCCLYCIYTCNNPFKKRETVMTNLIPLVYIHMESQLLPSLKQKKIHEKINITLQVRNLQKNFPTDRIGFFSCVRKYARKMSHDPMLTVHFQCITLFDNANNATVRVK